MNNIKIKEFDKQDLDDWISGKMEGEIKGLENTRLKFEFEAFPIEPDDDFNDTLGLFKVYITHDGEEHIGLCVKMTYSDCVGLRDYFNMLIAAHNKHHQNANI